MFRFPLQAIFLAICVWFDDFRQYSNISDNEVLKGLGTHLFVKVPRPGDSEGLFRSSSQAAICYYQSNHSKVEAISLSALPKNTTSELAGLSSHYPFFMLNVKQRSCEYKLLKSFVLTRPGNRTQVCRLRSGCSKVVLHLLSTSTGLECC